MDPDSTGKISGSLAELERIYADLSDGFATVTHDDGAWFDMSDASGESLHRFADQLDQDARRLTAIASRLRTARPARI